MLSAERPWLKVYREKNAAPEADFFEGSLHEYFASKVGEHRGKTALAFFGQKLSFEDLDALVNQTSAALSASGVGKGDRVALMLPNCPQYVACFFATMRLGAVVTQVNPLFVEREISHILKDSGAKAIIAFDGAYERVKAALPDTGVETVVVVGLATPPEGLAGGHVAFGEFVTTGAEAPPPAEIDPAEDVAVLQYTGGTTGVSKGAMLTHRNLIANVQQSVNVFVDDPANYANNEKLVAVLPYFHIYGLTCAMLFGLHMGVEQLVQPRFDPQAVVDLVREERPALFAGVPTMYMALMRTGADLKENGFGEIRFFTSGGSAMPVNLLHSVEEATGRRVHEGYGLSEASPVTHFNPPAFGERRPGSIGVPVASTDSKIVDVETGEKELAVGEVGELIVQGPQVMKGYLNMPDETAAALRDGWLYTGDVARMDEDGYFWIVDRKKDMIIASGYNVYPRDIEEVLFEHEAVSEAVAVGVPDEYRGETVKAFVVLKPGAEATEDGILAFCKERLAAYKAPKSVEFRDELPKSTVGKMLRRVLAEEARAEAKGG